MQRFNVLIRFYFQLVKKCNIYYKAQLFLLCGRFCHYIKNSEQIA